MIFTVRKNIYYHRIDEPAPGVTLHIISESKITFSVCVTTLAPFVTSDCPGRSSKNAQLYLFHFWAWLDWSQCLDRDTFYLLMLAFSLYFDILFYSPENLKYSFFLYFLNIFSASKLELMMSIVCGCLSAQVKSTIFQIVTCKVSQVKWENEKTPGPCALFIITMKIHSKIQ